MSILPDSKPRLGVPGAVSWNSVIRKGRGPHALGIAQIHPAAERLQYLSRCAAYV